MRGCGPCDLASRAGPSGCVAPGRTGLWTPVLCCPPDPKRRPVALCSESGWDGPSVACAGSRARRQVPPCSWPAARPGGDGVHGANRNGPLDIQVSLEKCFGRKREVTVLTDAGWGVTRAAQWRRRRRRPLQRRGARGRLPLLSVRKTVLPRAAHFRFYVSSFYHKDPGDRTVRTIWLCSCQWCVPEVMQETAHLFLRDQVQQALT